MAFSKTYICNRALSKLGETRVSNVDTDDTKKAKVIRFMWDSVIDSLLQSYPWNFAIKRTSLAADASAPSWGWNNRFTLPVDFLALLEIKNDPDYVIENGFILTDEAAPLYIKYVYRVTDTGLFDAMFAEAAATKLAYEGCEEITQSNTKKEALARELKMNIAEAFINDSIQDMAVKQQTSEWILARATVIDDIDYNG